MLFESSLVADENAEGIDKDECLMQSVDGHMKRSERTLQYQDIHEDLSSDRLSVIPLGCVNPST